MRRCAFAIAVPHAEVRRPQRQIERAAKPEELFADGLRIWKADDTPMLDLGSAGAIMGVIFLQGSTKTLDALPAEAPDCGDPHSFATWLLRECWGAYVAILIDRHTNRLQIMVDPSGLLSVYHTKTDTHLLIVSHPALIEEASGKRPQPSWPNIRSHLAWPDLRQRGTCLAGVYEFGRGELVTLNQAHEVKERLWSPASFMPVPDGRSLEDVAHELRLITTNVVAAWANLFGQVLVAASGGVDSSMVCAALAIARRPFDCATLATADPSGDESSYVKLLAEHFGVRSATHIYDVCRIDPLMSVSARLARPSRKPFMGARDAVLLEAGESINAKVLFDGNGGDNLFCFLHSAAPIVDRLLCEGLTKGSAATFIDMCRLTDCGIPTMARAVLRRFIRKEQLAVWAPDLRLLVREFQDLEQVDPVTAWFDVDVGSHKGKAEHLTLILKSQNKLNGLASVGLPRFSPLMSQPLVEYCLGVQSWIWCNGGLNRAPARAAFAADLPREILVRTSKAGPDSFIWQLFEKYRPIYRELLLDGLLLRHGLLDRAAIVRAFEIGSGSGDERIYRLLDLVEAENWARSWQG
jgi:asparagine synthase (glutamine-hydrolysing)